MRSLKLLSVAGLLGFALGVAVPVLNTRGGCQNGLYTGGSCLPTETDAISTLEIRQASQIDQSGCQPGTYTCDWPVGVVALVCDGSGTWQFAAQCGYQQHCTTYNGVPFCVNNAGGAARSALEDKADVFPHDISANNELEARDDALAARQWGSCSDPGIYVCRPPRGFIILVCDGDYQWVVAAYCGQWQVCDTIDGGWTPYCLDIFTDNPKTRDVTTELSLQIDSVPTASELTTMGGCEPYHYTCSANGGAILVCNSKHVYQFAAFCTTNQNCETVNNIPYCIDKGEAATTASKRGLSASAELATRENISVGHFAAAIATRGKNDISIIENRQGDQCDYPGTYQCGYDATYINICSSANNWVVSAFCGNGESCVTDNGGSYCS